VIGFTSVPALQHGHVNWL